MTTCLICLLAGAAAPPVAEYTAAGPGTDRPTGRLIRLTPDGTAELTVGGRTVTVRDAISLHQTGVSRPPLPVGPGLLTTTGDRIPGRVIGGNTNAITFRPAFANDPAEWKVPVGSAAVVWFAHPAADTPADPARYPWLTDTRRRDTLLFRNADTARGTFDGFAGDPLAVRFKPDGADARALPTADLAAVAFNPSLARTRKPKGPYAHLVLRDGTRLDVVKAAVADSTMSGTTLFGQPVVVPLAELVALDVCQGKAVYLSDLKPVRVEQSGFLGPVWPWAADRSVRGEPLRVRTAAGRETFDKGIGTHPRTVLAYDLGGKYRRFEVVVGLDPDAGGRGWAVVRVIVDGKPQPRTALAGEPAAALTIDVTGAKELVLETDFGPAGGVRADVNWCDARLVQ